MGRSAYLFCMFRLVIFRLFPVFLLFPKIEARIDAERAERVGDRQARLAIVVSVQYHRSTDEILTVVIYYNGTCDKVEVDVLYPAFVLEVLVVYPRFFVANAG